jgi:hypothetical protein
MGKGKEVNDDKDGLMMWNTMGSGKKKKLACSGQRPEGMVHNRLHCFKTTMMITMNMI